MTCFFLFSLFWSCFDIVVFLCDGCQGRARVDARRSPSTERWINYHTKQQNIPVAITIAFGTSTNRKTTKKISIGRRNTFTPCATHSSTTTVVNTIITTATATIGGTAHAARKIGTITNDAIAAIHVTTIASSAINTHTNGTSTGTLNSEVIQLEMIIFAMIQAELGEII